MDTRLLNKNIVGLLSSKRTIKPINAEYPIKESLTLHVASYYMNRPVGELLTLTGNLLNRMNRIDSSFIDLVSISGQEMTYLSGGSPDFNGLPVIQSALNKALRTSVGWTWNTEMTLFCVVSRSNDPAGYFLGGNYTSASPGIITNYNADFEWWMPLADPPGRFTFKATSTDTQCQILAVSYKFPGNLKLWINGNNIYDASLPNNNYNDKSIQNVNATQNNPSKFTGKFAEIIGHNIQLNSTQMSQAFNYFIAKYRPDLL